MHRIKKIFIIFSFLPVIALAWHFFSDSVRGVPAYSASDAIAVRVIPNPGHYSSGEWYRRQSFQGSPQTAVVDDYEGVRDGRTVYVNVANIDDKGTASLTDDSLYTNIYLITYNQDAEAQTIDIFAQILKHWRFNSNLDALGTCSLSNGIICVLDSECPKEEYCRGYKARVIRDTRRLESLVMIGEKLIAFKAVNQHFPLLKSGTYLPHKSLSVWPSWQQVLAQELKTVLPKDPINRLGAVLPDYNRITGWDEKNKKFATNLDDPNRPLPENSMVFLYATNEKGDSAKYCGELETGFSNISAFRCSN